MKSLTRGGEIIRQVQSGMSDTLSRWGLTQLLEQVEAGSMSSVMGKRKRYEQVQELKTPQIKDAFNEMMSYQTSQEEKVIKTTQTGRLSEK